VLHIRKQPSIPAETGRVLCNVHIREQGEFPLPAANGLLHNGDVVCRLSCSCIHNWTIILWTIQSWQRYSARLA